MPFVMEHFSNTLAKSIQTFENISAGTNLPFDIYQKILSMLNYALDNETPFNIKDRRCAKFACSVISSHKSILEDLFESKRFEELMDLILSKSDKLIKKLLVLYYRKFDLFDREENEYFKLFLIEQIKKHLRLFNGRNKMVLRAKEHTEEILSANFHSLLSKYGKKNIIEIKKDLYLNEQDDFYIKLRLIKLLEEIKTFEFGKYDESLFGQIIIHREKQATDQRLIGEECVFILMDRSHRANLEIPQDWINFILRCVGDPRSPLARNHNAWNRIGNYFKSWLIRVLSQGDIVEFLEGITDGHGDEVYKYRKAFWMQYVKYVRFAKIMVGKNSEDLIRRLNPAFYTRFISNPTTYSRLNETERSCIYMDFGDLKIIEGTHNALVRFYTGCPIDLNKKEYNYTDFYIAKLASNNLIRSRQHRGSSDYSWQNFVRNELNQKLGIHIKLKDIMLPEDTGFLSNIANDLQRNGQVVN